MPIFGLSPLSSSPLRPPRRRTASVLSATVSAGVLLALCALWSDGALSQSSPSTLPDVASEEIGVESVQDVQPPKAEGDGMTTLVKAGTPAGDEAAPAEPSATAWINELGVAVLSHQMQGGSQTQLISPLGLATVLAMLADGAGAATAGEFEQALGLADASEALPGVAALWDKMKDPRAGMVVQGANGLWIAPQIDLDAGFAARQTDMLEAAVETIDFTSPATLGRINAWFGENTGGMIPDLLDRLEPETMVVLGNALYLRGDWMEAFDAEQTRPELFRTASGDEVEVQMMHREASYLYREDDLHQAIHLPFNDPEYQVTILLPKPGTEAAMLLTPTGPEKPSALLDRTGYRPIKGHFAMPSLDLALGGDMTETLRALGLLVGQDYSGITEGPLRFDQIVHRTALKLDESGAEAAAATAAGWVRVSSAGRGFDMRVDRPFILDITHRQSGAILFVGHIGKP